ncbi:hypothetical protein [Galactobacillus timonensis]|uniref:hypothetical protein n=1 Tax=Galactobacillus timonensis TaxID=2041840 RepID=UPI000C83200B|nr:hypothetical protein [Galactobacillus timonensis]
MIPRKTRQQIANQLYLTKTDIQRLLGVSQYKARRIYDLADGIDTEELKYRVEPTKVRLTSVSKVTGLSLNLIKKQAEEEQ